MKITPLAPKAGASIAGVQSPFLRSNPSDFSRILASAFDSVDSL